eukprot:5153077-Amphidinium_carterae.4
MAKVCNVVSGAWHSKSSDSSVAGGANGVHDPIDAIQPWLDWHVRVGCVCAAFVSQCIEVVLRDSCQSSFDDTDLMKVAHVSMKTAKDSYWHMIGGVAIVGCRRCCWWYQSLSLRRLRS